MLDVMQKKRNYKKAPPSHAVGGPHIFTKKGKGRPIVKIGYQLSLSKFVNRRY